jgi:hypothetical protein
MTPSVALETLYSSSETGLTAFDESDEVSYVTQICEKHAWPVSQARGRGVYKCIDVSREKVPVQSSDCSLSDVAMGGMTMPPER